MPDVVAVLVLGWALLALHAAAPVLLRVPEEQRALDLRRQAEGRARILRRRLVRAFRDSLRRRRAQNLLAENRHALVTRAQLGRVALGREQEVPLVVELLRVLVRQESGDEASLLAELMPVRLEPVRSFGGVRLRQLHHLVEVVALLLQRNEVELLGVVQILICSVLHLLFADLVHVEVSSLEPEHAHAALVAGHLLGQG